MLFHLLNTLRKRIFAVTAFLLLLAVGSIIFSQVSLMEDLTENTDPLPDCAAYGWPERETPARIYDFFFTNLEFQWWDIRFHTLYPEVDGFIVLESNITFSGLTKPLHFNQSIGNFSNFLDKIHHIILDKDVPDATSAWERENFQRQSIFTEGFKMIDLKENDVLLLSDVDEIPKPKYLRVLKYCMPPKAVKFHAKMSYYSYEYDTGDWWQPKAILFSKNESYDTLALRSGAKDLIALESSWHCSYCFGTIAEFQNKFESFSHQEHNTKEMKSPRNILKHVSEGVSFFENNTFPVSKEPDMPQYLKGNEKYRYMYDRHRPSGGFTADELAKFILN